MRLGDIRPGSRPSPCFGCELAPRCAAELLACRQFSYYQSNGSLQWALRLSRVPSRAIFDEVFSEEQAA